MRRKTHPACLSPFDFGDLVDGVTGYHRKMVSQEEELFGGGGGWAKVWGMWDFKVIGAWSLPDMYV